MWGNCDTGFFVFLMAAQLIVQTFTSIVVYSNWKATPKSE